MFNANFTSTEVEELRYERFNHPHPRVQLKMEALFLKATTSLKHGEIAHIIGVTAYTLSQYFKQYQEGGMEKLKEINFYKPSSELVKHAESIEKEFRDNPVATLKEATARIEEITGLKRSTVQVGKFLKKTALLGGKWLKSRQKQIVKLKRSVWSKK